MSRQRNNDGQRRTPVIADNVPEKQTTVPCVDMTSLEMSSLGVDRLVL